MAVRFTMISGLFFRKYMKMGRHLSFSRVNLLFTSLAVTVPDPTDIILCDEE